MSRGESAFKARCCRVSYGILYRQVYNPRNARHIGQKVWQDPLDGKTYVEDQLDWFIKQVLKPLILELLMIDDSDVNRGRLSRVVVYRIHTHLRLGQGMRPKSGKQRS